MLQLSPDYGYTSEFECRHYLLLDFFCNTHGAFSVDIYELVIGITLGTPLLVSPLKRLSVNKERSKGSSRSQYFERFTVLEGNIVFTVSR